MTKNISSFESKPAIIVDKRLGTSTSPFVPMNETLIVNTDGKVILSEIPDSFERVKVTSVGGAFWYEIKEGTPSPSQYKVDYINKVVTFAKENIGLQLTFQYLGTGNHYFSPHSIYTKENNGKVVETLGDILDKSEDFIEKVIETEAILPEIISQSEQFKELLKDAVPSENERKSNELLRAQEETLRKNSETVRNTNESSRKFDESNRKAEELLRASKELERVTKEDARKLSESTRISDENTRKSNESLRLTNEESRVSNENTRISNENNRNLKETERISFENARQLKETERIDAETIRVQDESTRKANELYRVAKESIRVSSELERTQSEKQRKLDEDVRILKETERLNEEVNRKQNESNRTQSEINRVSNESTREQNEQARITSESVRNLEEKDRMSSETIRKDNELKRTINEDARNLSETNRISLESQRKLDETSRLDNENARKLSETQRISDEKLRKTNENTRVSNESKRELSESQRETNELLRLSEEINRITNEEKRVTNETTREQNEISRQHIHSEVTELMDIVTEQSDVIQYTVDNFKIFGDYSEITAYKKLNMVTFNGSTYMCIQDNIEILPTDNLYWKIVAQRGLDGKGSTSSVNRQFPDETGNINLILDNASTTKKGLVQLEDSLTSPSTSMALTSNQGKLLNEKLIVHEEKTDIHITSLERLKWNNKSDVSHTHKWNIITDKPSTFTPSSHIHTTSDITDLQLKLDSKANNVLASTSVNGIMSSADKTKLNGIATGANKTIVNDTLTSTSTTQGLSANKGKELNDKTTLLSQKLDAHLDDFMTHDSGLSQYVSNLDENDIYTTITFKRNDNTIHLVSTSSNPNIDGLYQTITWNFYNKTGTEITLKKIWNITYDENGFPINKVVM